MYGTVRKECAPKVRARVYSYPLRKKPLQKKKGTFAFLFWLVLVSCSIAVNSKNFLEPVYINRIYNKALNFEAENIYAPTLNYATNLNFMGKNLLAKVSGREKVLKINSAGELMPLKMQINKILAQYPKLHAGIYIFDYSTGKTVEINADEIFPAASIIKIPVLIDLFNRSKILENEGHLPIDLNEKMKFEEFNRTEGSGDLQYRDSGGEYSLDYLAKIMIQKSDNSATNMLIEYNGGINAVDSALRRWGFSKTQITSFLPDLDGQNTTTPKEISAMLYNLDNQHFLPLKSSASIKEYMSHVENRTLIKSQLPHDAVIVHKTGDIGKMLGDAGVIYSPNGKKFILAIMVKRPHNDYSARDLIQKVSKTVYNELSKI